MDASRTQPPEVPQHAAVLEQHHGLGTYIDVTFCSVRLRSQCT
jgi:hypothetical protein